MRHIEAGEGKRVKHLMLRMLPALALVLAIIAATAPFKLASAQEKRKVGDTDSHERVEHAILEIEREVMAAIERKDSEALGRFLADDFVHRTPSGDEQSRESFLKSIASMPFRILSVRGESLKVSVFGETAVLTGVQKATVRADDGQEVVGKGAFTDVFVKRGKRWLMVLAYSVELPDEATPQPK
jgi:ketosteroid isomerase-like protein